MTRADAVERCDLDKNQWTWRDGTVAAAEGEVRWHRDEAGFAQRMEFTIDADGTRLDAHGTMSHDGGPWEDDLHITYERIGS